MTDIQAQSITMVGEPNEVFTDYKLSHVPTLYVVSVYCVHTLPMVSFIYSVVTGGFVALAMATRLRENNTVEL